MKVTSEDAKDYIGEETDCGRIIIGTCSRGLSIVLEDLDDNYSTEKEVEVEVDCDYCNGTGGVDNSCTNCNGWGSV